MYRLLAAFAFAAALGAPVADDRGRPVVLLLHGRGLLGQDTTSLRQLWFSSLSSGARSIAQDVPIDAHDVRLVWYADVLDPRSTDGCDYPAGDPRSLRDADIDPDLKNLVAIVGGVLGTITDLAGDSDAGSQLRSLAADASFLTETRKRCASEQRLADAITVAHREGRPVILVAHSLGSLVAYDYLSALADSGVVSRLITIGSPLGSFDVRRLVLGLASTDTLALPKSVGSWVNIRNDGDPFATSLRIGRDIASSAAAGEPDPHEMVGYLENAATAGAVMSGWCAAFTAKPPAACPAFLRAAP